MALSLHPSAEWLACLCFNGDIQLLPIVTLVLVCVCVCMCVCVRARVRACMHACMLYDIEFLWTRT